jgi:hypothetical protein
MKITKEQLLQIDNYIYVCGIKYYDVRVEIVDHFANILEQKLDENPDLNFKIEIQAIHRNFSDQGFSKLLKEKTKSVTKKFYKQSLQHLLTFFKFPKIIISGFLFFILFQIMHLFEDKEAFFKTLSLSILGLIIVFSGIVLIRYKKNIKFLTLEKTNHFLGLIYNLFYCFYIYSDIRSSESFFNVIQNNIQLGVFVILVLFFWSGEYVYDQNKKLVKEQYPKVLI